MAHFREHTFDEVSDLTLPDISTTAGQPIEIELLYNHSYVEKKNAWAANGMSSWLVYQFLVQGKRVQEAIKEARRAGKQAVKVHDNLTLCISPNPPRNCWTLKRLSACMLFDNGSAAGVGTQDPPIRGDLEEGRTRTTKKYLPALASVVPFEAIARQLGASRLADIMRDEMPYYTGTGLNFLWRLFQKMGKTDLNYGVALAITAYFLDLAAINNYRRSQGMQMLSSAQARDEIANRPGGTFNGLLANSAGSGHPITSIPGITEAKNVINSGLFSTFGSGGKDRVKRALAIMYGEMPPEEIQRPIPGARGGAAEALG